MLNEIKKNNNITLIVIKKTLKWETSRLLFSPLFHCSSLEEKYNGNEWVWGYKLIMDFLLVPYGMVSKILLGDGSIMETGQSKDPTKARSYCMHLNIHLVSYEERKIHTPITSNIDKVDRSLVASNNKQKKNINACLYVYFLV